MIAPSPAPAVAAASAAARRRVRNAFEYAGAFSPERALAYQPAHRLDRHYFERLLAAGAILEAEPGSYYGDRETWAQHDRKRRKRALALLSGAVAIGAAIFGISQL